MTAFRVPNGALYEYTVAPFGLVNLPSQFTRLVHKVLGDALLTHAMVYIDDILVYSKDLESHIDHLNDILTRLRAARLSCSLQKSQLFRRELKFLGFIVGGGGSRPDPERVAAMKDMCKPLRDGKPDLKLVQVLCGCFNYYRKYIRGYASIMAPISDLTKGDVPMVWTDACQAAFEEIKEALCSAKMLAQPDPTQPFFLYTDASARAGAAILGQFRAVAELEPTLGLLEEETTTEYAQSAAAKRKGEGRTAASNQFCKRPRARDGASCSTECSAWRWSSPTSASCGPRTTPRRRPRNWSAWRWCWRSFTSGHTCGATLSPWSLTRTPCAGS